LIIVCGLPGAGKTTLAKSLEDRLQAIRLSADEWMEALSLDLYDEDRRRKIEALQWTFGKDLLACGLILIVEWGTWARSERDQLRLEARALGAAVELHYLFVPVDVLFERIQRRGIEIPPIKRAALARWAEAFQAPKPEEIALFDEPLLSASSDAPAGVQTRSSAESTVRKRATLVPERLTIRSLPDGEAFTLLFPVGRPLGTY
jgi:predicted kinase